MKKLNISAISRFTLTIVLFTALINALFSCSKKTELSSPSSSTATVTTVSTPIPQDKAPDLDLTTMSATMIYSTIFDMLIMPEDYLGKSIKVSGWFQTYTNPQNNEMYFAVVVPDATACCQQGLEIVWPGEHKFPEDFPKEGETITVTGIYKIIEDENGISYNYLEISTL